MTSRSDQRRIRSRRRRRRTARVLVKSAFWTLVLAGVFVLGLGYGRTLSDEDELRTDDVTITQQRDAIQATLPTRTVTVTKTVAAKPAKGKTSAVTGAER